MKGMRGAASLVLVLSVLLAHAAGVAAARPSLRLVTLARVRSATITLADLLPSSAPLEVKQAARAIVVGSSPQSGIGRVLQRSELEAVLSRSPLTPPGLILPARILVEREGQQISRTALLVAIRNALLHRSGFDASGLQADQIVMPFPIYASPGETLVVDAIERDPTSREVRFRFRFVNEPQRPPFSVLAPVRVDVPVLVATRTLRSGDLLRPGDVRAVGPGALPAYLGFKLLCPVAAGQPVRRSMLRAAPLVVAGQSVVMVMQGNGYTLTTTVTATQSAFMGQLVQVRNPATQAAVTARVIGPGQVEPVRGDFHELRIFRH